MIRETIRRAARDRHCDGCWPQRLTIRRGDLYRESVASPRHDDLNNEHWWRLAECQRCAEERGRPIAAVAA